MSGCFLAFGEVLFDVFPSYTRLGGAPLNVTCHASRLGLDARLVSALGDDSLGKQALAQMKALGLDTTCVAVLSGRPTGRADITLIGKDADYTFNTDCAWDFIPVPQELAESVDCLYFGSLCQRSEVSRTNLRKTVESVSCPFVFYDVNVRKDCLNDDILSWSLSRADTLKVNEEELPLILSMTGCESAQALMRHYSLSMILLTEGSKGASIICENGSVVSRKAGKCAVVDTVGAGDSLSAGFIASWLQTHDPVKALNTGLILADYVVSHKGAIPDYDDDLRRRLEQAGMKTGE